MSLASDLLAKPPALTPASKYTVLNGVGYLAAGLLLLVWPGVTQALFRDPAFAGREEALMRVIGLTIVVIGWFYVFGGRSGSRQAVAASIIDRLLFVPPGARATRLDRRVPASFAQFRDPRCIARAWRLGAASPRTAAVGCGSVTP